ncbi:hypothetical protein F0562_012102 [Nyssa sinensis]|uniref:SWIM-type domain-containing protein n=1 Tax=Nyssa sinensis TaxID=561372 RepID=A0A5J4ZU97_9ASTE|nr:hypothetical protein F0562_012102 [Nyssa sinensis]
MDHLKGVSADAHTRLTGLPIASWARHAFDPLLKNDHIKNNITESFNNWVGNLRGKPILTMLDGVRSNLMSRIRERYEAGTTWERVVIAKVKKRLNKTATAARKCTILFVGGMEFEVKDRQGVTFVVDLDCRKCVCGAWKIGGLSCKHAAAAIGYKMGNIEEYGVDAFSKDNHKGWETEQQEGERDQLLQSSILTYEKEEGSIPPSFAGLRKLMEIEVQTEAVRCKGQNRVGRLIVDCMAAATRVAVQGIVEEGKWQQVVR